MLAKRTKPPFRWSFPGGKIEAGETPEQAVIREVREEVSLEVEVIAHANVTELHVAGEYGTEGVRYTIHTFACMWKSGKAKAGPEASSVRWVALDRIDKLETTDNLDHTVLLAERALQDRKLIPFRISKFQLGRFNVNRPFFLRPK